MRHTLILALFVAGGCGRHTNVEAVTSTNQPSAVRAKSSSAATPGEISSQSAPADGQVLASAPKVDPPQGIDVTDTSIWFRLYLNFPPHAGEHC